MEKLLSQKNFAPRWYERFPRALPVGIFVLTMAITALSVFAIERAETQREAAQLEQTVQVIASGLERRASANAAYLRSGAALFSTQKTVDSMTFHTFIEQLEVGESAVGLDGIGWAMKVDRADVGMVEQSMRGGGNPTFAIRPAPTPDRQRMVPILYLQPESDRNRHAIGYDMYSEGTRRAAMDMAERLGHPVASGKVVLVQDGGTDGPPGFLVYMPVYAGPRADGRQHLRGFVYSPFKAGEFLTSAVGGDAMRAVGVRIYDGVEGPSHLLAQVSIANGSGRVARRAIDLAGRRWVLVVEAPSTTVFSTMSMMTLLFGLLVATLLLVLARLVTQQAVEDRAALVWFEQQSSIRNSLMRELNHRVKNTLANVLSIIALTRRRAKDLDSFADSLEGRIRALSATHDLLTQSEWGTTPLRLVVETELAPYAQDADRHIDIGGPDAALAPNDALSLGLVIHELATNAAKYGALSEHEGCVRVRWDMVGEATARLSWEEVGGPPIDPSAARKRGFGTDLIEKIVAHELRNPVDLRFEPDGVRCILLIPVRERGDFAIREKRPAQENP